MAANYGTGQLATTSVDVGFVPAYVSVTAFGANPNPAAPGQPVELSFTVENATYVTILGTAYQGLNPGAGILSDSIQLPGGLRTSTSFSLLAFNTNTGQVSASSTEVQVSPDPIDGMIAGGLVNIDGNLQPVVAWSSTPCTVSLISGQQAGYEIDFPAARSTAPRTPP